MSLSNSYSKLIDSIFVKIEELVSSTDHATDVPDYNAKGIDISKHNFTLDGYLITHINQRIAYDERGQQHTIHSFIDSDIEKVCRVLDSF